MSDGIKGRLLKKMHIDMLSKAPPPPPPPASTFSVYMHKEGKRKSNDINYAQVNKTKVMIYSRSSKLNGTKPFFF